MKNSIIAAAAIALCASFLACSQKADDTFMQGVSLYNRNDLEAALPYFEAAAGQFGANSEVLAYLGETYRRLGNREEAVEAAEKALTVDPCNSFAHTTLFYLYNPMYGVWEMADREKAWSHIGKGIECNPDDGNVWLAAWTEAIYRQDRTVESKSLKMMVDTGFLTPSILAFNRWMLHHLPPNTILLTNGDMDTYPAVALQETEGFRSDVAIMNFSLLNTGWYQKHMQDRYNVEFPLSENELENLRPTVDNNGGIKTVASQIMEEAIKAKAEGKFDRPVAISITVSDISFEKGFEDHFVLMGAFNLWSDKATDTRFNLAAIDSSLASLNINDFAGPFVSASDRSPVRRVSTGKIAFNFANLAILVIDEKLASGHPNEAMKMLQWAQRAEKVTIHDPEIAAELEELKTQILTALEEK